MCLLNVYHQHHAPQYDDVGDETLKAWKTQVEQLGH